LPRHRRAARCTGSNSIGQTACSPQIPIEPAAPVLPQCAVSSLGGFRTPAARICRTVTAAAGIRNPSQQPKSHPAERPKGKSRPKAASAISSQT
jgi:hypothetical protein